MRHSHFQEYDEFYDLTLEGKQNLPPSIVTYLNPHHKPRVRRTVDEQTNQVKATIIKSRIVDLEVYNPRCEFDYRISISVESPWEGNPKWLENADDNKQDRRKDRISYRHRAYQVDLTQVKYENVAAKLEHELEVEISTDVIRMEIDKAKSGQADGYMDLVRGFVDNVRILCREGSAPTGGK
jgi:hypothetical protein